MANWYGTARSNHVKIKDMAGLKTALEPFEIHIHTAIAGAHKGMICFWSEDGDSGAWPGSILDEDEAEVEFDPAVHICPFMEDDQILVMMEAGAEKLRYITGWATAYTADGRDTTISLGRIYQQAADEFGVPRESITPAEY